MKERSFQLAKELLTAQRENARKIHNSDKALAYANALEVLHLVETGNEDNLKLWLAEYKED